MVHDSGDVSTKMDVDIKGKATQKPCASTSLLLSSDLVQRAECSTSPLLLTSASILGAECSSDAHRLLVQRVEQALEARKQPSERQSESDYVDEDSFLDDSADERTLWELHKSMQKGARDRKGVQVLSAVQKKKVQKKKGNGKAGGKGSLSITLADS